MTDTIHTEIYAHKNGKRYSVVWYYDNDSGSPLEDDGYGVTERLDFDPTNERQLAAYIEDFGPELEEETRLRLMRVLQGSNRHYGSGLYYDVLSSLHLARTEWGFPDPVKAMEIVEKDYAFLKGWYDESWHWITASVAPLDENDEPEEHYREFCSRYESTILDDDEENSATRTEVINDLIASVEHVKHHLLHKGQLELDLRTA
jgi:hypothetical protein